MYIAQPCMTGGKTDTSSKNRTVFFIHIEVVEIRFATPGGREDKADGDLYLYVKSGMKQQKEEAMSSKLTKRFVQEIENIRASLSRKRGIKEEGAVNQRTGRLRERYPSVSKLYTIEMKVNEICVLYFFACTRFLGNFGVFTG